MDFKGPLLTIHQMLIFITVVEENSFLHAGKKLHMTQSAVSKTISKLEKELGVPLFIRSTRYLKLTASGRRFYEGWKKILENFDSNYREALELGEKQNHRLRIGLMNTARPEKYFYPVYETFTKSNPDVECVVESQYMTDLVGALQEDAYDLILLPDFTRFYLEKLNLKWRYFAMDQARILMARNHPLAKKQTLKTTDILDQQFLTVGTFIDDKDYLKDLSLRLEPYGKKPEIAQVYKTAYDIKLLFRPGEAVLLVDAYFDYPDQEQNFVIRPLTDQKNGVICAWNPKRPNQAVNRFLECIPE